MSGFNVRLLKAEKKIEVKFHNKAAVMYSPKAYEGQKFNFIVPELNDWFKFKDCRTT